MKKLTLLALSAGLTAVIAGCSSTDESQYAEAEAAAQQAAAEERRRVQEQRQLPDADVEMMMVTVTGSRIAEDSEPEIELPPQKPFAPTAESVRQIFKTYAVNPTISTKHDAVSTFAMDVDTGSYHLAKEMLLDGFVPDSAGIRVEEFVNAFSYNPMQGNNTFNVGAQMFPSPFREGYEVLHLNIQAKTVLDDERQSNNLVLVADTSGSMSGDKIALLKEAFTTLVSQLDREDQVAIVTYSDEAKLLLPPTLVKNKRKIFKYISMLAADGSTNAEAGIHLAYETANKMFMPGYNNRVVLTSDGMANVGNTNPELILNRITDAKNRGIFLTTVGVGQDMYNDYLLEQLANKGNGHYLYFADSSDIQSAFIDELYQQLETVAKDAKIQVIFDPQVVSEYRLIGYENRDVADNRFLSEQEDGGEIGSGHQVNALYEVKLVNQSESKDFGKVSVAYKKPLGKKVRLIQRDIAATIKVDSINDAVTDSQLAYVVAAFAEKLRQSYWAQTYDYSDLLKQVNQLPRHYQKTVQVRELEDLIFTASRLDDRTLPYEFSMTDLDFDRVPVLD